MWFEVDSRMTPNCLLRKRGSTDALLNRARMSISRKALGNFGIHQKVANDITVVGDPASVMNKSMS